MHLEPRRVYWSSRICQHGDSWHSTNERPAHQCRVSDDELPHRCIGRECQQVFGIIGNVVRFERNKHISLTDGVPPQTRKNIGRLITDRAYGCDSLRAHLLIVEFNSTVRMKSPRMQEAGRSRVAPPSSSRKVDFPMSSVGP